jgi:hypothetical protein
MSTDTPEPNLPLASNPETLTAEEIQETLEKGGPFVTLRFVDETGGFDIKRIMNWNEVNEFYASLGSEIVQSRAKYNINPELEIG